MNHTETTTAANTPNATRAKMKKGGPRFKLSPLLYYVPFSDKRETPETVLFWKTGRREYYAPMTREECAGFLAEYYAGWPEDEKALGKALAPLRRTRPGARTRRQGGTPPPLRKDA